MKFIPAWKEENGNRLMVLAPNHVFDTRIEASEYQLANFLFYIPFGFKPDGIVEMELENGKGGITHVICDGPFGSQVAVIAGPLLDRELREAS